MFPAFSDPIRLRILSAVQPGELCVCDLVEILKLPQPTISRHLSYLRLGRAAAVFLRRGIRVSEWGVRRDGMGADLRRTIAATLVVLASGGLGLTAADVEKALKDADGRRRGAESGLRDIKAKSMEQAEQVRARPTPKPRRRTTCGWTPFAKPSSSRDRAHQTLRVPRSRPRRRSWSGCPLGIGRSENLR